MSDALRHQVAVIVGASSGIGRETALAFAGAGAAIVLAARSQDRLHALPGLTDTPLVLKRPTPTPPEVIAHALQPEDVAEACLFVASLPARARVPELMLMPSRL